MPNQSGPKNNQADYQRYVSLFEDSPVPIWDEDFSFVKNAIDELKRQGITDLKSYFEQNLHEVERVSSLMIVNDINDAVVRLNEAQSKIQMLRDFRTLITRKSTQYAINQFVAIANGQKTCEFDAELKTFAGNIRYVRFKWTVVKGFENSYKHVYLSTTDLTERIVDENLMLQNSNKEKAVLLKEVHHRVKNNLQIITSLLNLQARGIEDERTRDLFEMSLNRIQSMATVHELLYQSENFSKINYQKYLKTLVFPLLVSMKGMENNIDLRLDIEEIELNINTAIPLGLLINEILTNSLKHGIVGENQGIIYITLCKIEGDHYELLIGDDGVGFDEDLNDASVDTLGLQLIVSLSDQLSGTLIRDRSRKGTHYIIRFMEIKQRSAQE
jgi:two-component sensor histidine kinase